MRTQATPRQGVEETGKDPLDEMAKFFHRKDRHEETNGNLPFEYCQENLCALKFEERG